MFLEKTCKQGPKTKKWTSPSFLSICSSLGDRYQPKLTILNFWTKLIQKGYFQSKKKNNENHYWVLYIRISLGSMFQLQQFWYGTNFLKKDTFNWKQKKMNTTNVLFILELAKVPNFSLNWQFWFFWPNLPKMGISSIKKIKWTPPLDSAYSN